MPKLTTIHYVTISDVNQIGNVSVGPAFKPFVIAEISANHGGNLQAALNLVDIAGQAGASAVKLQHYRPETLTIRSKLPDFKVGGGT